MPPLQDNLSLHQLERPITNIHDQNTKSKTKRNGYFEQDIVYTNVSVYIIMHTLAFWALWRLFSGQMMLKTCFFGTFLGYCGLLGVTSGSHRLWAHRTYKAKTPLKWFLMILQTMALQNDIYIWARDHRVHHKFTDTSADPHNSKRGFFFCHVGWLLMKKNPDVIEKGKSVDVSDIASDPVVQFQRKYYIPMVLSFVFILPTIFAMYAFGETFSNAFLGSVGKFVFTVNGTWCINSVAHYWGSKPYDGTINPVENSTLAIVGLGEGWHNYHHTFPWDYKTGELGNYSGNLTTGFLDLMAYIGQAYDLKTVPPEMIRKRAARTGDGSYNFGKAPLQNGHTQPHHHIYEDNIWGWDDKDMKEEYIKNVNIRAKAQ